MVSVNRAHRLNILQQRGRQRGTTLVKAEIKEPLLSCLLYYDIRVFRRCSIILQSFISNTPHSIRKAHHNNSRTKRPNKYWFHPVDMNLTRRMKYLLREKL